MEVEYLPLNDYINTMFTNITASKEYLYSTLITFVATFLTAVGASLLSTDVLHLTTAVIAGILIAGVRAATKVVIETMAGKQYAPAP